VEVLERLIERIEALVADGALKASHANGLLQKLVGIIDKLNSTPPLHPACNQLEALINQLMALVKTGKLTASEGYAMIGSAINAGKGAGCAEDAAPDGTGTFDWGTYAYQAAGAAGDGVALGESNVRANPATYGLYTADSIMDLRMGKVMLRSSNGWLRLRLQLEKTDDLTGGVWTNAGDAVQWMAPAGPGKAFYRVKAKE
jgi:hypothetical protein